MNELRGIPWTFSCMIYWVDWELSSNCLRKELISIRFEVSVTEYVSDVPTPSNGLTIYSFEGKDEIVWGDKFKELVVGILKDFRKDSVFRLSENVDIALEGKFKIVWSGVIRFSAILTKLYNILEYSGAMNMI